MVAQLLQPPCDIHVCRMFRDVVYQQRTYRPAVVSVELPSEQTSDERADRVSKEYTNAAVMARYRSWPATQGDGVDMRVSYRSREYSWLARRWKEIRGPALYPGATNRQSTYLYPRFVPS